MSEDNAKALLGSAALLLLGRWAEHNYGRLPQLPPLSIPPSLPALSVIVPARNEAANLPTLLGSLSRQHYPGPLQCIIVDDGSQDETAAIAAGYDVRLIRLQGPPPGWSGKAHACHRAVEVATGEWLLFTDADTWHAPYGPAHAVAFALQEKLDGLSLFMAHETSGPLDRLALMVALAGYFAGLPDPTAVLNGQYILVKRSVYEASGGFSAVPLEVLEDLALGRHLHNLGYRLPVMRSDDVGYVHMYRTPQQVWGGMVRLTVSSLRWSGLTGLLSVLFTILLAWPLHMALNTLVRGKSLGRVAVIWLSAGVALLPWARRFGHSRGALLAPVAAAFVQAAAIWGLVRRLARAGVEWRGRWL
jgi:chlorobactene glucosyltransferase